MRSSDESTRWPFATLLATQTVLAPKGMTALSHPLWMPELMCWFTWWKNLQFFFIKINSTFWRTCSHTNGTQNCSKPELQLHGKFCASLWEQLCSVNLIQFHTSFCQFNKNSALVNPICLSSHHNQIFISIIKPLFHPNDVEIKFQSLGKLCAVRQFVKVCSQIHCCAEKIVWCWNDSKIAEFQKWWESIALWMCLAPSLSKSWQIQCEWHIFPHQKRLQHQWSLAAAASAIQANVACNSAGVFDAEHFQQIAETLTVALCVQNVWTHVRCWKHFPQIAETFQQFAETETSFVVLWDAVSRTLQWVPEPKSSFRQLTDRTWHTSLIRWHHDIIDDVIIPILLPWIFVTLIQSANWWNSLGDHILVVHSQERKVRISLSSFDKVLSLFISVLKYRNCISTSYLNNWPG